MMIQIDTFRQVLKYLNEADPQDRTTNLLGLEVFHFLSSSQKGIEEFHHIAYRSFSNATKTNSYTVFMLGCCFVFGWAHVEEFNTAFKLMKMSTKYEPEEGLGWGLYGLGFCYEQELGCKMNAEKSADLYRQAAERGNQLAREALDSTIKSDKSGNQIETLFKGLVAPADE